MHGGIYGVIAGQECEGSIGIHSEEKRSAAKMLGLKNDARRMLWAQLNVSKEAFQSR